MSRESIRAGAMAQQHANQGTNSGGLRHCAPTKHRPEIPPMSPSSKSSTPQSGRRAPAQHRREIPPMSPSSKSFTPQSRRGGTERSSSRPRTLAMSPSSQSSTPHSGRRGGTQRSSSGLNLPPLSSLAVSGLGAATTDRARHNKYFDMKAAALHHGVDQSPQMMTLGHGGPPLSHAAPTVGGSPLESSDEIGVTRGRRHSVRRTIIDSVNDEDSSKNQRRGSGRGDFRRNTSESLGSPDVKREERLAALKKVAEVKGSEWELDRHVNKVKNRRNSFGFAESAGGRLQGNPLLPQEGLDHAEPKSKSYQRQNSVPPTSVRSQRRSAAPSTVTWMDTFASGTRSHVTKRQNMAPAGGINTHIHGH